MRDSLREVNVHLHIIPERSIFTAERTQLSFLVPFSAGKSFILDKHAEGERLLYLPTYSLSAETKNGPAGIAPDGTAI